MSNLARDVAMKLNRHAPTILTIVGSIGIAATAYLAHQAGVKSTKQIIEEEKNNEAYEHFPMSTEQKVELVWMNYLIPTSIGIATVVCFVTGNAVNLKRQTAILGAYTLVERAYSTYRDKMVENLGVETETIMREDIARERAAKKVVDPKIILGEGDVLIEDEFTGQIFSSNIDLIQKAMDAVNDECVENGFARMNYFYDYIGARSTDIGTMFAWTEDRPLDLILTPIEFKGGELGFGMEFRRKPSGHYFDTK